MYVKLTHNEFSNKDCTIKPLCDIILFIKLCNTCHPFLLACLAYHLDRVSLILHDFISMNLDDWQSFKRHGKFMKSVSINNEHK